MGLNSEQIDIAANALASAWRTREPLNGFPSDCAPKDIEDGYRIQNRLLEILKEPIAGWKLGVTSKEAMERCQLSAPIMGSIWKETTRLEGQNFQFDWFMKPMVEIELAVLLKRDFGEVSAVGEAWNEDEIIDGIETAFLTIELADCRFADPTAMGWPSVISDNSMTGAFVVGPEVHHFAQKEPGSISVKLNGEEIASAQHDKMPFSIATAVTFLANSSHFIGDSLKKGQLISTGSLIVPAPITTAGVLSVECTGYGDAAVELV